MYPGNSSLHMPTNIGAQLGNTLAHNFLTTSPQPSRLQINRHLFPRTHTFLNSIPYFAFHHQRQELQNAQEMLRAF
jgi:hypothetical protein